MNLTNLTIMNRLITDISPLSELTELQSLSLHTNWISDISPLSGLTNLTRLIISENPIADINPLRGLTNLTRLHVHGLYPYQLSHYLAYDDGRDPKCGLQRHHRHQSAQRAHGAEVPPYSPQ